MKNRLKANRGEQLTKAEATLRVAGATACDKSKHSSLPIKEVGRTGIAPTNTPKTIEYNLMQKILEAIKY